jgi:hypothetical protein
MKSGRKLSIAALAAALLLTNLHTAQAQTAGGDCRYFTDTGHYVCDEFLQFFETRGGVEIFGFPISEEFDDPEHGLRVQYFQCARMELHPYNRDPYKVQLGLLADELGYIYPPARPEQIPAFNNTLHHYFPETGHVVSYAFLEYFRQYGGVDIFGYPRSEFMFEDGHIVQYFQRARMEWHPEDTTGSQMRLAYLGETFLERSPISEEYTQPQPPPLPTSDTAASAGSITRLDTSASVRYVITGRKGTQTVFVYVNDQQQKPVQSAAVRMTIHYPSGDQTHDLPATNASGFARFSFDIRLSPPGQKVVIDVTVTYGSLSSTTQTFFLPWW